MSRTLTAERKRRRRIHQRRQRLITLAVIVVATILLLAIFYVIANQPAEAPIPDEALTRYQGLEQGRTAEGYPTLGEAGTGLPVTWYCNFDSDACALFHGDAIDRLVQMVRDGEIILTYVPIFSNQGNSRGAARAAACAAEQGQFWPLHDAFYRWKQEFGALQAFTNNRIATGVGNLPMDRAQFDGCIRSGRPDEVLNEATADVNGLVNFQTTPAIVVNNAVLSDAQGNQLTEASAILEALEALIAERAVLRRESNPDAPLFPEE